MCVCVCYAKWRVPVLRVYSIFTPNVGIKLLSVKQSIITDAKIIEP